MAAVLALAGWSAAASTVNCDGTGRTFSLTTAGGSSCAATDAPGGRGTLSGNPNGANPDPLFGLLGPGLVFLSSTGGEQEDDEDRGTTQVRP